MNDEPLPKIRRPATAMQGYPLKRRFCRACAVQLLYQLDVRDDWQLSDAEFDLFWCQIEADGEIPPVASSPEALKREVRLLLADVLEHRAEVDRALASASANWRLERMNVVDRNVLRLGLSEMLFNDKVPVGTAINEAIELAREYGHRESPAFVNGILDNFSSQAAAKRGTDKRE